jgi:hypothetical protein
VLRQAAFAGAGRAGEEHMRDRSFSPFLGRQGHRPFPQVEVIDGFRSHAIKKRINDDAGIFLLGDRMAARRQQGRSLREPEQLIHLPPQLLSLPLIAHLQAPVDFLADRSLATDRVMEAHVPISRFRLVDMCRVRHGRRLLSCTTVIYEDIT